MCLTNKFVMMKNQLTNYFLHSLEVFGLVCYMPCTLIDIKLTLKLCRFSNILLFFFVNKKHDDDGEVNYYTILPFCWYFVELSLISRLEFFRSFTEWIEMMLKIYEIYSLNKASFICMHVAFVGCLLTFKIRPFDMKCDSKHFELSISDLISEVTCGGPEFTGHCSLSLYITQGHYR